MKDRKKRLTEICGGCCGYDTPFGRLVIEEDGEGITAVHFPGTASDFGRPSPLTDRAAAQLIEYFEGKRREFSLPLHPNGTAFQRTVWEALQSIPYGETRSYLQIAQAIGRPSASRAVGAANRVNPIPFLIPCHRVIGTNGSLTGYAGGLALKQALLALEKKMALEDMARESRCSGKE
ncbi:MAG: cysteine methyltransferase [Oscillospiraceae bacterium]|nr:MAG: cysteine methyltransferase [Oscillospiraceae bacterium]